MELQRFELGNIRRLKTETNATDHINTAETGCTTTLETVTSIQSEDNGPLDDRIRKITSDKRYNLAFNDMGSIKSRFNSSLVQKGSLNGQANEERSTERITANEINKNFEEKKFEPDSKTDKTYCTEQISLSRDNNISKTEAHDVNVIGAINNDDSKANGTQSHTSIDAGGVPSRHVQPVRSSLQSSTDKTTKTNGTDHINTVETWCTPSLGAVTSVQSDGNGQSDNGSGTLSSDKHNNAAYSSGSKAADPSVQKGSLNGQANEERSTERITANEINKTFEEKNFEPDSKTDKTYSTEQISLNRHSNISETEAHDVNVNVIGAINNDDSKANGTLSHTSIDAGGVPSRHVQPVTSSLQSSRDKTTETIETYHISTVETGCTPSLGAVTSVQSDGNRQSDNGNGTISSDKRWYEVFTFMSYRLKWNTFLKIYRRLLADTDSKALSYVESDIENTRQEYQSVKETIYRLMNKWKQRNPNGTMQSIVEALDKCGEKLMSEKLMSI